MSDLNTAIKIACDAHAGQTDKAGEPYILHPLRLMHCFYEIDMMIVAVLHDVVEDSHITLDFLMSKGFGKNIIEAIEAITKKRGETYSDFVKRLSSNSMAVKVKIEDLKDNLNLTRLKSIGDKDLQRAQKYHKALIYLVENNKGKIGGTLRGRP